MASSPLTRQHSVLLLPAITKIAFWRFKQMWRFLLITWLGMLAMVVLVCALPLFSRVAVTADLRSIAATSPDGQNITVQVSSTHPTDSQIQQIEQQLNSTLRTDSLAPYVQAAPQLTIETPMLNVIHGKHPLPSALLIIDGYNLTQAAEHLTIASGRLPETTNGDTIELALSQRAATALGLKLNDTFQGRYPDALNGQVWNFQLVGIIAPPNVKNDPFWSAASPFGLIGFDTGPSAYGSLASIETIKPKIATMQVSPDPTLGPKGGFADGFHLYWSYPFDLTHLDANSIDGISQQVSNLRIQLQNTLTQIPNVSFAFPVGSLVSTLGGYTQEIVILEIVITLLMLITLAIVLFLVSMLSDMLVERQASVIATLRSRGASRRHVFGAFFTQGVMLSLAALIAGPLLAILLVRLIAQFLLTPDNQVATSVITSNPLQAALDVKWYAIVAVIVSLFVMIVAIRRASKLDIVTLRRESSRIRRVPFWKRFNLDILLVLLIIIGYVAYDYGWQTLSATHQLNPTFFNLFQAFGFLAPPLVVAAALLLFLRVFPLILRLASFLSARKRSAAAVLAFAQMERSPRPAARIIILLALALASSIFLFTLIATKDTRTVDQGNYAVGADFYGTLPTADLSKTFAQLKREYSSIAGVQSATIGYYNNVQPVPSSPLASNTNGPIHLYALDADTYARTAVWPAQNAPQSLADLMAQLRAHRSDASAHNVVYAVVDAALWQQNHLSVGKSFTLPMDIAGDLQINFVALAEVNNIPTNYDTILSSGGGVGLIVDYQSYATVYNKAVSTPLAPNDVMLQTSSDANTLAHIRQTFPDLNDRRAMITANQENNVHLDIIGVLAIAVGAALILALIGTLLSSWLNAASRRTNFAVVRALGMTPPQVASVLLWEQGFVYILAFLIGIGLGALLTIFVTPVVSLLDLAGPDRGRNFYPIPPVQTIIPSLQLTLLLGGLVLICLVALLLMARIVSRPSIGQTLRLNED